jgi:predicted lipoprotein with Yx(FWY)xxD motif
MNMKHTRLFAALLAAGTLLAPLAALAQDMKVDANGMTLYTFDNDAGGVPSCYDDCAVKWPPYLVAEGAEMGEGWTQVDRTDGTKQWAYDGKPVYLYIEDKAAGDMLGDGVGGVWHVIK